MSTVVQEKATTARLLPRRPEYRDRRLSTERIGSCLPEEAATDTSSVFTSCSGPGSVAVVAMGHAGYDETFHSVSPFRSLFWNVPIRFHAESEKPQDDDQLTADEDRNPLRLKVRCHDASPIVFVRDALLHRGPYSRLECQGTS